MGRSQRNKGARGEREFANRVQQLTGIDCSRRLGQERDGGADVHVLDRIAVQVKRAEHARLKDWMKQATDDTPPGMLTALAWRNNRSDWVVVMPISDWAELFKGQDWPF